MADKNFEIKTTFKAVDKMSAPLNKMQSRISKFATRASRSLRRIDRVMSKISKGLVTGLKTGFYAAAGAAAALGGAIGLVMKQFSKVEDAQAAFQPILGGVGKAKEMVDALNKTAATTPFQFETLAAAAQQLLPNMAGDIGKTIELTRMLGDTAGGNAQKMNSITRGYNKALLKGKVDMESLNMIAEAGVPIFQDLGKVIGKTGPQMFKAISAGEVSTEQLTKAFKQMTGEGGIFFNGMQIASETLSGKISTLKDNVGLAAAELGSTLAPTLKELTDYLITVAKKVKIWVTQNKELIRSRVVEFVKKIPVIIEETVYWLKKIGKWIAVFYTMKTAVMLARGAMWALNTSVTLTSANIGKTAVAGKAMGASVQSSAASATKSVGKLQAGFFALQAFFIGWEVGTILYEKLVDPIIKATHELARLKGEVQDTQKRDLSKRGIGQLEKDIEAVDKATKLQKKSGKIAWSTGMMPGMGGFSSEDLKREELQKLEKSRARLAVERDAKSLVKTAANIQRFGAVSPMSPEAPTTGGFAPIMSRSESREVVDININDTAGGKATVVRRGKSSQNLNLAHTGGMP